MRNLFFVSIIFQVLCIIHAARTGRIQPWVYIIVFLPGAGTIAYIVSQLIPDLMGSRRGHQVRQGLLDKIDPKRGLRRAERNASIVDSVDAKASLAQELLRQGDHAGAIAAYERAMTGLHSADPSLLSGLARAKLAAGDGAGAQAALDSLKANHPEFDSADAHLTYAQALEVQAKYDDAREEYQALVQYYPGEEARFRYAELLMHQGAAGAAREVYEEIVKRSELAPGHYRRAQRDWIAAAKRELKAAPAPT